MKAYCIIALVCGALADGCAAKHRLFEWQMPTAQPSAEIQPEVVDKYLTPGADEAFQRPAIIEDGGSRMAARAEAVALPASPWHPMAVVWSDPCDMNHPWIPSRTIYSGPDVAALTFRTNVANPLPMRWGMSNGVPYSVFVPVTNGVTVPGQAAEFFEVK